MIPTDVNLLSLKHATNIPKLVTTIPNVFVNVGLSIPNKTKTKNTTTGLKLLIICIKLTLKYKYSVFPLANVIAVNKPIGIIIVTYSHSVNLFSIVTLPDAINNAATIHEHKGPVAEIAIGYGKSSFTKIYLLSKIIPPETNAHEKRKNNDFTQYNFDSDSICNSWYDFTRSRVLVVFTPPSPPEVNDGTD